MPIRTALMACVLVLGNFGSPSSPPLPAMHYGGFGPSDSPPRRMIGSAPDQTARRRMTTRPCPGSNSRARINRVITAAQWDQQGAADGESDIDDASGH